MLKKLKTKQYSGWFLLVLFAAPASIFIHEIGHFLAAYSLNYSNSVLHHASFSRGNFPGLQELDQHRWIISAGGPFITFILTLVACFMVKRNRHKQFFLILGLAAPVRNLAAIIGLIKLFSGASPRRNDEVKIALFSHIPTYIPLLLSALILIAAWIYLIRQLETKNRWATFLVIIIGGALGNIIWLQFLGPVVLP